MFLFKCTVILALLCGVNSHHCIQKFGCDENGLFLTEMKLTSFPGYFESLLTGCADDTHCSNCTSGTGHKLYDSLAELVPVERCYSICFSNVSDQHVSMYIPQRITVVCPLPQVTPSVESGSGRRGLFKTNVFAEDTCSSSLIKEVNGRSVSPLTSKPDPVPPFPEYHIRMRCELDLENI